MMVRGVAEGDGADETGISVQPAKRTTSPRAPNAAPRIPMTRGYFRSSSMSSAAPGSPPLEQFAGDGRMVIVGIVAGYPPADFGMTLMRLLRSLSCRS